MSELKYDVVFTGQVRDGFDVADVKENFARLFKIPAEKAEKLFRSPHVVLKAGVDRQTADKYEAALTKTGAVIIIEALQTESAPPIPAADEPAAVDQPSPAGSAPETKIVGPLWGRKVESATTGTTPKTGPQPTSEGGGYGSLARGMAGDYQFTVGETLSEAWQKVNGNKGTIMLAGLIYLAILIALGIVAGLIMVVMTAVAGKTGTIAGEMLTQVAQIVVATPLGVGLLMLGVRMAIGAPARPASILGYYDRILPLTLTSILYGIMVLLGFLLLIIPGIYLSIAYILALPLVVDKGLGPWQALEASRKAITHRWFAVCGFLIVLGLICVVAAIPLFIGLIWVVPLYLIAMGILYRNIFGVSSVATEP